LIVAIERIGETRRIAALRLQLDFLQLEAGGGLELWGYAQPTWSRRGGQVGLAQRRKRLAVEAGPGRELDRRHSGTPFAAWHRDAIAHRERDEGRLAQHLRHLVGRHVLALPAEAVA